MEQRQFRYGEHIYNYALERSDRKSFSLIVFPSSKILVKSPIYATESDIYSFLVKKWIWLEKQLREFNRYRKNGIAKEYVSGESFYYLGRQYMLKVGKSSIESISISPGVMTLKTSKQPRDSEHNKTIYEKWYLERCESIFKRELCIALKDYGIDIIPKLKIREMKSRWGSYQQSNTINLNPKLLQAPRIAIRYVITHELCHINHKKHDKNFYALLESRLPEWRRIKDELEMRFG